MRCSTKVPQQPSLNLPQIYLIISYMNKYVLSVQKQDRQSSFFSRYDPVKSITHTLQMEKHVGLRVQFTTCHVTVVASAHRK